MSTPLFCAYSGVYIKAVDLPHIYSGDRLTEHGPNGAPARVLVAVPRDMSLRGQREGQRSGDDMNVTKPTLEKAEVWVYSVPILMPPGHWHRIEIAVTTDRVLGARLPPAAQEGEK